MEKVKVLSHAEEGCEYIENIGWIKNNCGVKILEDLTYTALIKNSEVVPSDRVLAQEGDFTLVERTDGNIYTVKPLDTIEKISKSFGVSPDLIVSKNHLKSTKLFIGQVLKI